MIQFLSFVLRTLYISFTTSYTIYHFHLVPEQDQYVHFLSSTSGRFCPRSLLVWFVHRGNKPFIQASPTFSDKELLEAQKHLRKNCYYAFEVLNYVEVFQVNWYLGNL